MDKKKKIGLILSGGLALVVFLLTSAALHPGLSTTSFCISCHEMDKPLVEYQQTSHFQSASGVRAECSSCHIPESLGPKLIAKIGALRHVYWHFAGSLETDEKYEDARLRMAERVWDDMKAHDSRECRTCHTQEAFSFTKFQNHTNAMRMEDGLEDGKTCIDCHKGMAHVMPDTSSGYEKLLKDLVAVSTNPKIKSKVIYPLETVFSYADKDGEKEARILAATKLTVLKNHGAWLRVRVDGWQQDDVKPMIYALQGKRIFSVALDKPAREKPTVHRTMLATDTEQTWHEVSYETWVTNEDMVQDIEKLWDYGSKLHGATCGQCHFAVPAEQYLANQWIGVMKDMKRNIRHLDKEQYRFLQKYLQLHAKDVDAET